MELRHLRCLVAVAEELHFGRAARRLHLSQPPVSLAIKELETELGVLLFERSSRRIALTPQGEEVLRDARAILARTESIRQHAAHAAPGLAGSLSIGFISLAAYTFLPDMLRRLTEELPRVRMGLHESSTDRIIPDLEAGVLDVGCLFCTPRLPASLRYQATDRYPLVVALPQGHALARLARVPLERLAEERFLLFEPHVGPLMYDTIMAACLRSGFSPRIFHAHQQHTIVSLVSGGVGVALLPSCVQVMQREGVVYRPLRGEQRYVETGVAWRASDDSPFVRAFLDHLPARR